MALISELITEVKANIQDFNRKMDEAKNKAFDFSNSVKLIENNSIKINTNDFTKNLLNIEESLKHFYNNTNFLQNLSVNLNANNFLNKLENALNYVKNFAVSFDSIKNFKLLLDTTSFTPKLLAASNVASSFADKYIKLTNAPSLNIDTNNFNNKLIDSSKTLALFNTAATALPSYSIKADVSNFTPALTAASRAIAGFSKESKKLSNTTRLSVNTDNFDNKINQSSKLLNTFNAVSAAVPVHKIRADNTQFNSSINNAKENVASFTLSAKTLQVAFVTAFAAIASAATIVYNVLSDAIQQVDELGKSAQKAGVEFESFQSLKFAADLSDVSVESLQGTLGKMSSFLAGANDGLKANVELLDKLGLSVKDLINLAPDQQFYKIATALGKVDNITLQRDATRDILGRGGLELMPLIQSDIEATRKKWEEYGLTLTEVQRQNSETFNDLKTELADVSQAFIQNIGANVAPAFSVITQNILDFIKTFGNLKSVSNDVASYLIGVMNRVTQAYNILKDVASQTIELASKLNPETAAKTSVGFIESILNSIVQNGLQVAVENHIKQNNQGLLDSPNFYRGLGKDISSFVSETGKTAAGILKSISPISATTQKFDEIVKGLSGSMDAASGATKKASKELDGFQASTKKASEALKQLDNIFGLGSGEQQGIDYITKNLPKGMEQLVDPEFNNLLASIRDNFQANGGKVNNQILQDLQLAKMIANTRDTTEVGIDENKNLTFKEFSNSGMQNAVKVLEDYIKGKMTKQQEVKITVEPTDLFIVKVGNSSYTQKRVADLVGSTLEGAAAGASK